MPDNIINLSDIIPVAINQSEYWQIRRAMLSICHQLFFLFTGA